MRAKVNCISVLAKLFRVRKAVSVKRSIMTLLCIALHVLLPAGNSRAGISDRVIAFVDDQAITMSELDEQYRNTAKISPDIAMGEVLETMINRILLLREARKYRIESASVEQVMNEYIDLKIRAFIRVGEDDIEKFYNENKAEFAGKEFEDVRDEIDTYLTEKELNKRLKETLRGLRKDAYIRIFLD